jgi:hypothetical protein
MNDLPSFALTDSETILELGVDLIQEFHETSVRDVLHRDGPVSQTHSLESESGCG